MIRPVIFVVDDDNYVRKALERLLGRTGIDAAFASREDFMNCGHRNGCDCLLLQLWLPDPRCVDAPDGWPATQRLGRVQLDRPRTLH